MAGYGLLPRPRIDVHASPKLVRRLEHWCRDVVVDDLFMTCGSPPKFDLAPDAETMLKGWTKSRKNKDAARTLFDGEDLHEVFPPVGKASGSWEPPASMNRYKAHQVELQKEIKAKELAARALERNEYYQNAIIEHDSDMGLFGRLPGEIRNDIYRLVCVSPTQPMVVESYARECGSGMCEHNSITTVVSGLASTCHRIRQELMPIFVLENQFKFEAAAVRHRCIGNWVKTLGIYARFLKKIDFGFPIIIRGVRGLIIRRDVGRMTIVDDWHEADRNRNPKSTPLHRFGHSDFAVNFNSAIPEEAIDYVALEPFVLDTVSETDNYAERLIKIVDSDCLAELVYQCQA